MTEHARVAIVGGGAMGAGLAYHLAEEGWTDIVLLEKGELTSGSTWHAAGLCTYFIGGYAIAQLHAYGVKFYPRLEELTGRYVSWHGCGSMRLAPDRDFEDWYRHVGSLAGRIGFEVCFLSPSEVKKLHPYLSLEGVRAVAMTPGDGHVDPAGVANAMADGARRMGARIQVRRQVTGIHRERNGEWRLRTDKGDIVAEHVVNAAGCYARRLQAMVGGAAPIANMLHHYVVTEPIPELVEREGELPVVRDPHASNYLRQEQKAGMIGVYETAGAAEAWNGADPEWAGSHELFEPDYDRIGMWLGRGLERIPLFGSVGLKRAVHGAITHTPDANPLLGPAPGLDNFWMCTGSSIGIAQGAGAGKYLAQWMVHGDSEINMASVDPRRFGDWTTAGRVSAKSVQDYGHMYAVPLPGEELPAGRPARVSSLHDALIARGAVHTEAFGWERPKWFSVDGRAERHSFRRSNAHDLVAEECRAVRERVGVMDFSSFSKLQVSGSGAGGLLRRLYANRPPRPGRIALAHRLSAQARIEGESTIAGLPGGAFYVVSGAAWELRDLDAFRRLQSGSDDVEVRNVSDEVGVLVVAGPRSRELLARLTSADLGNEAFPWLAAREIELAGVRLLALRISYLGALGWELHAPMAALPALYGAIREEGEAFGVADFGAYAVDSLRLEKGYKGMGVELTNEVTPIEAGLLRFVRGEGYVGQAALDALREREPAQRIAYMELLQPGDADILGGETVFFDGEGVGVATSGGYGHGVGKSLFFAYLPARLACPGRVLEVMRLGDRLSARVLGEAAFDPANRACRA